MRRATPTSDGKTLQNITYSYDNVGNITNRNNNGFNTNDDVNRNSEQSYEYDEMDRLTGSSGKFDYETWNPFWDKRVNTYTSEFNYSTTGKILQKTQENKGLLTETDETVTIAETTYDWSYEYSGAHPNAVTQAGPRTYSYDLNGNMTQMTDSPLTPGGGTASMTRTLVWDDENRLLKTTDKSGTNENITTYSYDAAGMRALKKGKYGTVQYVSDNYTVRNKDLISKHVFAGNTRLVSKTVMQEEKSGKMTATEQGAYYYHPDHLGSSSVVTDKAGKFYEQIEYFPYGETWINNKATAEQTSTPYKFTAKEYDEETGLYYYGARYYDAKLSRWCSADPPLARGDYLPVPPVNDKAKERNGNLPGMGGVFNSINLDAYHYAGDNPVKLVDLNGLWEDESVKCAYTDTGMTYSITLNKGTVTEGDNLTDLAEMQLVKERGTTKFTGRDVENKRTEIKELNNLPSDKIYPGQKLKLGVSDVKLIDEAGVESRDVESLVAAAGIIYLGHITLTTIEVGTPIIEMATNAKLLSQAGIAYLLANPGIVQKGLDVAGGLTPSLPSNLRQAKVALMKELFDTYGQ